MSDLNFMQKHEKEVNETVVRIFKYMLVLLITDYIFVIITSGGFVFKNEKIIFYSIWLIILIPIISYKYFNNNFKYIAVSFSLIISFLLYITSGLMAIFVWIIPIASASLYSNYKLLKRTIIFVVPLLIIGNMIQPILYPDYVIDSSISTAALFTIYFLIQFVALGIIYLKNIKRVNNMLQDSASLNKNINKILNKSLDSSMHLSKNVEILHGNVNQSDEAVIQISTSIQDLAHSSKNFTNSVSEADMTVAEIAINIEDNYIKIKNMVDQTNIMSETAVKNRENLLMSIEEIKHIEESTIESKEAVMILVQRSIEIGSAISAINNISKQTNLLALNASIEAARAGQHGKGFAVVADEIKELASQSQESSSYIQEILKFISLDVNNTVKAIDKTNEIVSKNVEFIKSTADSFNQMFTMQKDMLTNLDSYSKLMDKLNAGGDNIKEIMSKLNEMNNVNYEKITDISANVEELNATFSEISQHLENINEETKALVNINQ